jgi:hypothetical protein
VIVGYAAAPEHTFASAIDALANVVADIEV